MMTSMVTVWALLIFLTLVLAKAYAYWRRRTTIKRWYKSLSINKHLVYFQHLFSDIDGFLLSRQSRALNNAIEYTYGEIDFISFTALLSMAKPDCNTVFYDLGSGTGKAVLACAMVFNVKKSCGIELFNLLHQTALKQQHRLQKLPDYVDKTNVLYFINADFLHVDLSDATLIFINATAFFGETWVAVNQHLKQMPTGTIIITTSKRLFADAFSVIKVTSVQMSWGIVYAYIQQRIAPE